MLNFINVQLAFQLVESLLSLYDFKFYCLNNALILLN